MASSQKKWNTGQVQVYTGDGKGKSTAAFGLAVRAMGAGLRVYIGQFVKGPEKYSEIKALERWGNQITIEQFGRGRFIQGTPEKEDIQAGQNGLEKVRAAIMSGTYDLVIMDEANIAVYYNLFSINDLLQVISDKPNAVELVITGRNAHPELMARADLVTEMNMVKHYFNAGVAAREGIES